LNETVFRPSLRGSAAEAVSNAHGDAKGGSGKTSQALSEVRRADAPERMPTVAAPGASGATTAKSAVPMPRATKLEEIIASQKNDATRPPLAASPPQAKQVSAAPALSVWRTPLTRLLATRLGPMASLIVDRELTAGATLGELIDRLAGKIPSAREQAEFRVEATRLLPRSESGGRETPPGPNQRQEAT
jgi:hypothetical protein